MESGLRPGQNTSRKVLVFSKNENTSGRINYTQFNQSMEIDQFLGDRLNKTTHRTDIYITMQSD